MLKMKHVARVTLLVKYEQFRSTTLDNWTHIHSFLLKNTVSYLVLMVLPQLKYITVWGRWWCYIDTVTTYLKSRSSKCNNMVIIMWKILSILSTSLSCCRVKHSILLHFKETQINVTLFLSISNCILN